MSDGLTPVLDRVVFSLLGAIGEAEVASLIQFDEQLHGAFAPWDPDFERLSQARVEWCVLEAPSGGVCGAPSAVHRALDGEFSVECSQNELRLAAHSFVSAFYVAVSGGSGFDIVAGAPVEFRPRMVGSSDAASETPWMLRAVVQGSHLACVGRPLRLPPRAAAAVGDGRAVGWRHEGLDPMTPVRRIRRAWGRTRRHDSRIE